MNNRTLLLCLAAVSVMYGCATKTYGRLDAMEMPETAALTCADIDGEITRVQSFVDDVNRKSAFSGADVLAFLIDFGIGNAIEKTGALKSADERMSRLKELSKAQRCSQT